MHHVLNRILRTNASVSTIPRIGQSDNRTPTGFNEKSMYVGAVSNNEYYNGIESSLQVKCPRRFFGIIGQDPNVHESNRLHVVMF